MTTLHYIGIAEPGPANWSLSFPSFPGVVTTANDFAAMVRNGRDALTTIVDAMQEAGVPLPAAIENGGTTEYNATDDRNPRPILFPVEVRGASVRINITMDDGLLARVDDLSRRQGASRSAMLARGARMLLAAEGSS